MEVNRYIQLRHAYNVRDIGGYATSYGKPVVMHRFVRADDTSRLDKDELDLLYNYGVRNVIDLRNGSEYLHRPDAFMKDYRFLYRHYSLLKDDLWEYLRDELGSDFNMGTIYVGMLKDFNNIKGVLQHILKCEGGILFHCSAGKDRTGTLACLLHKIAGVSDEDIVIDYSSSYGYLSDNISQVERGIDRSMLQSLPTYITKAITYLNTYPTIDDYLLKIGLTQQEIDTLRSRLINE